MAEDKDFAALCEKYAAARSEGTLRGKALNELYEACIAKGRSLDMARYAIEEAIARRLEERMIYRMQDVSKEIMDVFKG